jgi:hypothetical protein
VNEAAASPTRDHGNGGFLWPHDWRHAQAPGLAEIALVDDLVKGSPVADRPDLIGRPAEQQRPGPAR